MMTNSSIMPSTSTSKIPLPKSALSPSVASPASTPVSRIPVKRDFRSVSSGSLSRDGSAHALNDAAATPKDAGTPRDANGSQQLAEPSRIGKSPRREIPTLRSSVSPSKDIRSSLSPAKDVRTPVATIKDARIPGKDDRSSLSPAKDAGRSAIPSYRRETIEDNVDGSINDKTFIVESPPGRGRVDPVGKQQHPDLRQGRGSDVRHPGDLSDFRRNNDAKGRQSDVKGVRPSDLDVKATGIGKGKSIPVSKIPLSPGMLERERKASVESLSRHSPEWDPQLSYEELISNEPLEIDCSSSDNSRSPMGRGRQVSPGLYKMRRTSPDGESVSPSKTRRPSPSKIPISAEYMKHSSRSSSQSPEDFLTPRRSPDNKNSRLMRPGFLSSTDYETALDSEYQVEDLDELEDRGGEGGGEAAWEGGGEDIFDLGGGGGEGLAPLDKLPRAGLHLDLSGNIEPSSPARTTSSRSLPQPNWSIEKDSPAHRKTQSTEKAPSVCLPSPPSSLPSPPDTPPEEYSATPPDYSTSPQGRIFPPSASFKPLKDTSSVSSDSEGYERLEAAPRSRSRSRSREVRSEANDTSRDVNDVSRETNDAGEEGKKKKKKNYEAFVMTGDRMINLAKTPANLEFQSKYYKPNTQGSIEEDTASSLPTSPTADPTADPSSQQQQQQHNQRRKPGVCRSLVRNSKSEDQLAVSESLDDDDEYFGQSCHTLLSSSENPRTAPESPPNNQKSANAPRAVRQESTDSSSSRSKGSSADHLISQQTSPEFSTSSLITCSEHYNGQSLLDNLSPQSPQSPETPEWSLIANGDSFHKDMKKSGDSSLDTSITSRDNRVIITIGQNEGGVNGVRSPTRTSPGSRTSPGTSSGTITPPQDESWSTPRGGVSDSSPPPLQPPSPLSSEEESDMDSLHSYHPPVRNVDIPSANRLAKRLFHLEGFKKGDVSRHLSKNNEFSRAVAEEYCRHFDLGSQSLDEALKYFLSRFCLNGETQERERVLLHFSKRYLEANSSLRGTTFQSHDAVHTLTCAIMLLNTDLHNQDLKRKMTPKEFVENLGELNDGHNFPAELLFRIYSSIKLEPIQWAQDDDDENSYESGELNADKAESPAGSPDRRGEQRPAALLTSAVNLTGHQIGGVNPFLALPDDNSIDYKRGFAIRKCCFDANGKKTKMGKRGWKMFYLTLRDLVLFCFKDEQSAGGYGAFDNPNIAVRIHHAVAFRANDYRKKRNVFRLLTADRAEFLFQTSDEQELFGWLETINTVVARFSSPQLPAPCSNSSKFQRPLYPASCSRLSLADQLTSHRSQLDQLDQQLDAATSDKFPPGGTAKKLHMLETEKVEFLLAEKERYKVYIQCLETLVNKPQAQLLASPLKLLAT